MKLNARGKDGGFTLIEIAIVLVVVGLILSGGLMAVKPVLQNARTSETNSKLDRIEDAILVYAIRNNCLPCPATAALATGAANAGASLPQPLVSNCSSAACTNARGVVPWVTLGISESDATDAWGSRISYAITTGLETLGNMDRSGTDYTPLGTLSVTNLGLVANAVTDAAAYVLVSHGADKASGYAMSSGVLQNDPHGSAATDAQGRNRVTSAVNFVQDEARTVPGVGYYDDIVRWRSKPIIVQSCGSASCGNP